MGRNAVIVAAISAALLSACGTPIATHSSGSTPPSAAAPSLMASPSPSASTAWATYRSVGEKASFKYPSDWTLAAARYPATLRSGADATSLRSPDGSVTVNWSAFVAGIGGGCDPGTCPLITRLGKIAIPAAPGLYVEWGVISDGGKFSALMAVQDSNDMFSCPRPRDCLAYPLYTGLHNGAIPGAGGRNSWVLFSINGIQAPSGTPTFATQAEAVNYLNSASVQQAKQILLSLTY